MGHDLHVRGCKNGVDEVPSRFPLMSLVSLEWQRERERESFLLTRRKRGTKLNFSIMYVDYSTRSIKILKRNSSLQ